MIQPSSSNYVQLFYASEKITVFYSLDLLGRKTNNLRLDSSILNFVFDLLKKKWPQTTIVVHKGTPDPCKFVKIPANPMLEYTSV